MVIAGCPLISALVDRWSFAYLAEHFVYDKLNVHFAPRSHTCFSRHYGTGLGKGGCTAMTFAQFVKHAHDEYIAPRPDCTESALRYYLQVPMVWNERQGNSVHGIPDDCEGPEAGKPMSKCPAGQVIEDDLRSLDWHWLKRARDVSGCRGFDTCQLWAGHGGGCTPLHFDSLSNFLAQVGHLGMPPRRTGGIASLAVRAAPGTHARPPARLARLLISTDLHAPSRRPSRRPQVRGRKQVLLFPPAQTWHIYPYQVGHPMDNFAMVDLEAPDVGRFPALARARALEAVLSPGDVLWLPRFYWHYVHQLDAPSENVSLNFWVGKKGTEGFMAQMRTAPLPADDAVAAAAAAAHATAREMERGEQARLRVEAADERWLASDAEVAMNCLHLSRMIETACTHVMRDERARGNHFMSALAVGAEVTWPADQSAASQARRLRREVMSMFGADGANALLRMATRHGRLHPGLAPAHGHLIDSEKGGCTPSDEVERWFRGEDVQETYARADEADAHSRLLGATAAS